jgi:hypothetical protein
MKSVLSVVLALAVVTSSIPLTAQEKKRSGDALGPLAHAISREAAKFATAPPTSPPGEDWSKMKAGTEVLLTIRGESSSVAGTRTYVSADQSRVTFLDLTDPGLPPAVAYRLRWIATNHPDFFTQAGNHSFRYEDVRVEPDGIYLAEQKVSTLDRVVQEIERDQIVAVTKVATPKPPQEQRDGLPTATKIALWTGVGVASAYVVMAQFCRTQGLAFHCGG